LARSNPAAVGVFESFGIDYCCGGNKSLSEACLSAGLSLNEVITQVEDSFRLSPIEEDCRWLTCPLSELADHIVEKHHAYSRKQLPVLVALGTKVRSRHGENRPELARLLEFIQAIEQELTIHMFKEERVLFPLIRQMETVEGAYIADPHSVDMLLNPIRRMMEDHDDAGALLRAIRSITNDYQSPNNGCASFQALYAGLKEHEEDLHRHIHLENNILFPRALEMARSKACKIS
jgi:regulator of cell morphogenesis and NO signaling